MLYQSTRDKSAQKVSSAFAIKQGLASDGGLFVPEEIPSLSKDEIMALVPLGYPERAAAVLSKFLTDYSADELLTDCREAYNPTSFRGGCAPLISVRDNLCSLELWHGPTAAFKDMALQIMPRLLSRALGKCGEKRTALILVATSGDTGKAALEGYKNVPGVKITVFYPVDGVSRVQKLQMATQTGDNVDVCAIKGNFDDAQNGVKAIFSNEEFRDKLDKAGYFFSSANSINWGRLVPQIAYYVSAYCDLLASGKLTYGQEMDVCVPTGNFGNIFAAYLACRMGLPIGKLICASNSNNILTDFLNTGVYDRNRDFHVTMSPSMDILISSNLERLLYFIAGPEKTASYMQLLAKTGRYEVEPEVLDAIREKFVGYFASETETADTIADYYRTAHYLPDTHTAVALCCAGKYAAEFGRKQPLVVASTASPYKFAADVLRALDPSARQTGLEALDALSALTRTEITYPLCGLAERKVRFETVIAPEEMADSVISSIQ